MIDDKYEALNEGELVMAVFVDIKKCFDSISHAILLQKLSLYGIHGIKFSDVYKWPSTAYTYLGQQYICW